MDYKRFNFYDDGPVTCLNVVFIIYQKSVLHEVDKRGHFINYVLREYQEELIEESQKELKELHMAFVFQQKGTAAYDFEKVDGMLEFMKKDPAYYICADHCREETGAGTPASSLWYIARMLLEKQAEICEQKGRFTDNRIYFISEKDIPDAEQRKILNNAREWSDIELELHLIRGEDETEQRKENDFSRILSESRQPWYTHLCRLDEDSGRWTILDSESK